MIISPIVVFWTGCCMNRKACRNHLSCLIFSITPTALRLKTVFFFKWLCAFRGNSAPWGRGTAERWRG